jgi:tetratricopeptide (TPR) repeat protein
MIVIIALFGILFMQLFPGNVNADPPYDTFSVNSYGKTFYTQPAYEPSGVLAQDIYIENDEGEKEYSPLSEPQDLFVDQQDEIYIADTGNDRIVHLDKDGELVRVITIPDDPLNQPSGIYVTPDDVMYIADTGNKRVIKVSPDGEVLLEFTRPESEYIDEGLVYEPTNMIVDDRGFVYVVSRGTYQGIIQFNPEGEFYGFYGTNITEASMMDRMRNMLYSQEQLKRQVRLLPNPINNITMDRDGYIYTVSKDAIEEIKKLNIRGENQWKDFSFSDDINVKYLQRDTKVSDEETGTNIELTDVIVDENGIVTVADKKSSVIAQFNKNGEILFYWGPSSTSGAPQQGVTKSPVALGINSKNDIFILDDTTNLVQVLKPTAFEEAVREAFVLTQKGKYDESEKYWDEMSRENALFTPSYTGLAKAAFYEEDYEQARDLYKRAGDVEGYSDAFWQIRLKWFQKNFPYLANAFVIAGVGSIAATQVRKRRRKKTRDQPKPKKERFKRIRGIQLLQQLKHAFYTLKHPIDGFDDIRFRNMGGYLSAFIILGLVVSVALGRIYLTSFTFQPIPVGSIQINSILTLYIIVWVSWVVCQYLIGTIRRGQARFKDIFVGSAYALFPVFLLGLPLALLSNMMTLSEASIYYFFNTLMIIWCVALFFWMVQTLQNYSVGETITSILLTLFSMIILWVLIFIILGLASETIDFVVTLYQEVTM